MRIHDDFRRKCNNRSYGRGEMDSIHVMVDCRTLRRFMCNCRWMGRMKWGRMGIMTIVRTLCSHYDRRNGSGVVRGGNKWCSSNSRMGSVKMTIWNSGRRRR